MRLKKKLLHKLLRHAEENANGQRLPAPEFEEYEEMEVNFHIGLCYEAGFLHVHIGEPMPGADIRMYQIRNLTWKGHLELEEKKFACRA